jgi:hypothetical protein
MIDPMDPDAEFNRLRESVTDKKETKSKNRKVSSCICFCYESLYTLLCDLLCEIRGSRGSLERNQLSAV